MISKLLQSLCLLNITTTIVGSYAVPLPQQQLTISLEKLGANPFAQALLKPSQFAPFLKPVEGNSTMEEWVAAKPLPEDLCHLAAFETVCGDSYTPSKVLGTSSLQHMGLFEKNNCVLKLNRTKTYLGQAAFAQLLINPCTSISEIQQRQESLRYLVEHQNELRTISNALKNIHDHESKIFRFWYHNPQGVRKATITSPWANDIITRSSQLLAASLLPLGILGTQYADNMPRYINGDINYTGFFLMIASAEAVVFGVLSPLLLAWSLGYTRSLQGLLMSYARVFENVEVISQVISQATALRNIPGAGNLKDTHSNNLRALKQLFKTKTFSGEASIFSSIGNIQVAQNLCYATNTELRNLLQAIGTIDAFVSMATLMRDHELQPNKYCFVDFTQDDQPTLEAVNLWSSACPLQTLLMQTVTLTGSKRNLLVTGAFRSGKSTTLRTMFQAVLMAQAFGIAPAEKFRTQPFTLINFTTADVKKNDPTAWPEPVAHHLLFEKLDALAPQQNALIICDSAQDQWTDQAITQQAQLHNRYPNTLTVFTATNEEMTLDNFAHYHMSPTQERDNLPNWMFVLKPK